MASANKYYASPRWSNEIADCSMPMTFDTYSNCAFGCLYCFSQFQRAIGGAKESYLKKDVAHVNVERVKKMFLKPECSQFGEYIKRRKVMQWGGLSDQFDGFERKYGVTLELLKFFKEINYPLCFSTKSVWWTRDKRYMELFAGQKNWNVKFSIITLEEHKSKVMEKGVPTPKERLEALGRIAKADCGGATLRLRPFIIGVSTPSYLDLIKQAGERGATALSTEFFCLELRSKVLKDKMAIFNELCGFDVMSFYKKYSYQQGYLRLNRKVKEPFLVKMKEACTQAGMRFYVSDAHFKEMCCNGSCCGLPPDWSYSRGQWCEALQIAKEKGCVAFSDVSGDISALLSGFEYARAEGFNTNSCETRAKFVGLSMAEYMRWLWNSPQAGQSPYKIFEGILTPVGKDENGDLVYRLKS
jgi:DNA repair photolyase